MKKIALYILCGVTALFTSCDPSLLDLQNENTLSTGVYWKTESDIEAGVVAVYGMFYRQGTWTRNIYTQMIGMADEGVSYAGWTELNEYTKFIFTDYNFSEVNTKIWRHYGAYIDNKSLQVLIPKKYIKVRTYQLNPDQTIFIGGLAKIKFDGENKINVSFYISNELYLHRTKTIQADKILETQQFKLLVPPYTEEEALKLNEKAVYNYEITGTSDIFISGIGFIHITSEKCNVEVQVPKPILVEKIDGFM